MSGSLFDIEQELRKLGLKEKDIRRMVDMIRDYAIAAVQAHGGIA